MLRSEIKEGSVLVATFILGVLLLVLAAVFLKIVYNTYVSFKYLNDQRQAFWLAEAGRARAVGILRNNLDWYTDLAHSPEDDLFWLKMGAVGKRENLGGGYFKIVRERGKSFLYVLGSKGKATKALKLIFAKESGKLLKWEEL